MSKVSKTARASAGVIVKEKQVIPDEVYIKNLRIDLKSGLYVAQEGARALLRAFDAALVHIVELTNKNETTEFEVADKIIENEALYKSNLALDAELKAALFQIEMPTQDLEAARASIANYRADFEDSDEAAEEVGAAIEEMVKKEGDFVG